ncbi:HAD family hydrolase [Sorangium sp. So ce185]|uniref:HAD family hydrolase n=1 Tax=Sorangium sp. So ce185 TaxID=3133287 RepID=UPI003F61D3D5
MIHAVLFDLDNCLSAADEVGRELLDPVFAAIRRANRGELSEEALERAFSDCWRHALDFVAQEHGFSAEMLAAGWAACAQLEVRAPMRGYPDLGALAELPALRFLVTSGFRRLQESKIRALGIERLFAGIHVDAIDEPGRKGKQGIFEEILRARRLDPREVLVVGDNLESEIEAGNRLGIRTVQILRPGVPRGEGATYTVRDLHELRALVTRENGGRAP